MAQGQTVILSSPHERRLACDLVMKAPEGAVFNVREASRTTSQNKRMWAMLSDVSRAKPGGRMANPEQWKCLFMNALGHATRFETGLDGQPFPIGFSTSALNKSQMSDLMELISAYGAENGVRFTDPESLAAERKDAA